jgi:putative flippase GtrA
MTAELHRLLRFAAVGVLNTLLTLASFTLLTHAGCPAPIASAAGFAVGATNGYVLNRRWTFAGARGGAVTLSRYVAVQGLGAALSAGGLALVMSGLAVGHMQAEVLVLPLVTLTTYLLSSRIVFAAQTAHGL